MGVIFIGHSSRNREVASRVQTWLEQQGYGDVFVAPQPDSADRWAAELKRAGAECTLVVFLISPEWVVSSACQRDFQTALDLGKKVVGVIVAPTSSAAPEAAGWSKIVVADTSRPGGEAEGLAQLKRSLAQMGLRTQDFEWPPPEAPERPPYRGLRCFEEQDAGVFFGRETESVAALDALRRMRRGQKHRVLGIVGPSGVGKSSFLRAGILARARRDPAFWVLPVVRPDRDPLRGPTGLWASLSLTAGPVSDAALRTHLESLRSGSDTATPLLPIDPGDRFMSAEGGAGIALVRQCLAAMPDLLVVLTVRDDQLGLLDRFDRVEGEVPIFVETFRLPALSLAALTEAIERPATRQSAGAAVQANLDPSFRLELERPDALALLACTLERMSVEPRRDGVTDFGDYQRGLGGISGAINAAVTMAYQAAIRDPACPTNRTVLDAMARSTFIPALVRLDDAESMPRSQRARLDDLPKKSHPLLRHLIEQGVLTLESHDEGSTVEVSHEAVFRNWWGLAGWIREERFVLDRLQGIRQAAEEWDIDERPAELLIHRAERLEAAEAMLKRGDLAQALAGTPLEYLDACRAYENQMNDRELRRQRRRRQWRRLGVAALLGVMLATAVGLYGVYEGQRGVERRVSMLLTRESRVALAQREPERALRLAVAAAADSAMSPTVAGAEFQLARAVLAASTSTAVDNPTVVAPDRIELAHPSPVTAVAVAPAGNAWATGADDGSIRVWRRGKDGDPRPPQVLTGHDGPVTALVWAAGGGHIVSVGGPVARIWRRLPTGRWQGAALEAHSTDVKVVAVAADGGSVATVSADGDARAWVPSTAVVGPEAPYEWTSDELEGHTAPISAVDFSAEPTKLLTASLDGTLRVWQRAGDRWSSSGLEGHRGPVRAAVFGADGAFVLSGGDDGTVRRWRRTGDGWTATTLAGPAAEASQTARAVHRLALGADDAIVVVSDDGTVRWGRYRNARWRSEVVFAPESKVTPIRTLEVVGPGRVLTLSDDGQARIWHRDASRQWVSYGLPERVDRVAASNGSGAVLTAGETARWWDLRILVVDGAPTPDDPTLVERVCQTAATDESGADEGTRWAQVEQSDLAASPALVLAGWVDGDDLCRPTGIIDQLLTNLLPRTWWATPTE